MKTHKTATSLRASRVPAAKSATAPRHLINDNELRALFETLSTTIESNLFGGSGAQTPKQVLSQWQKQRATWVSESMKSPLSPRSRDEAEAEFKITDEAAVMLRRVLPIFERVRHA